MKTTLAEIGQFLNSSKESSDRHMYGQVQAVNTDAEGKVVGYEVSLGSGSDTVTCRKLAGAEEGDIVMVTLMKNGTSVVTGTVNGDNDALTALIDAANAHSAATEERRVYYAYATDPSGGNFSLTNTGLQYRGICLTNDAQAPVQAAAYRWEINPLWAANHAEQYLHEIEDGLAIYDKDLGNSTYAGLSALALTFYLDSIQQMKVGYDPSLKEYGVLARSFLAAGSGAGVKFDNTEEASVRGRFVQEIRDNGHWSLKLY